MSGQGDMFMAVREVGDRVELAPHVGRAGDRVGTVESKGRFYLHVRLDQSGTIIKVVPENVKECQA